MYTNRETEANAVHMNWWIYVKKMTGKKNLMCKFVTQMAHKLARKTSSAKLKGQFGRQTVTQMAHKLSPLNKPNINKNININNLYNNHDNNALAQVIDFYQKNMGVDVSPHIAEAIDNWLGDVDISLIFYAISEAVTANVRNWKYINSIIQSHFAAGRKTWAEAETAGQRRKEYAVPGDPWEDDVDDILLGGAKSGAD